MQTLSNWVACRSGARMTIVGLDIEGRPVKITGVDSVEISERSEIVATKVGVAVATLSKTRVKLITGA